MHTSTPSRSTSASDSMESTKSSDGTDPPPGGSASAGFVRSEPGISPAWAGWMQRTSVRTDNGSSPCSRMNFLQRSWWPNTAAAYVDTSSEIRVATHAKSVPGSLNPDPAASHTTSTEPSSMPPVHRRSHSVVRLRTGRFSTSSESPASKKCFVRSACGGVPTNLRETPPGSGPSEAWRKAEVDSLLLAHHDGEARPRSARDAHLAYLWAPRSRQRP